MTNKIAQHTAKYDVVALGELLIDLVQCGRSSQDNPLLEANPGGAPCNSLAMLKKLGHSTAFISKVGRDAFGNQLEAALHEVGICTVGLFRDAKIPTTLAVVHTMADGDRSFSFYRKPGADIMLSVEDVKLDRCTGLLENCKIFHFGTLSLTEEPSRSATKYAVDVAKKTGALLSFDPNLRESLWESLDDARRAVEWGLAQCDILKISDNEIQWLSGLDDCKAGIAWLRERWPIKLVLLSLGKDGSCAFSGKRQAFVPAFHMPDTIETTGAGDTFGGCALHFVLEHGLRDYTEVELTELLRFANAAAAIVTTRRGALRVMPTRDEIEKVLAAKF